MGENTIIEQHRTNKNYRTTKKVRSKLRYVFSIPPEENRSIEQQGTVNNRTFVLLNFRSIILAPTTYVYMCIYIYVYVYIYMVCIYIRTGHTHIYIYDGCLFANRVGLQDFLKPPNKFKYLIFPHIFVWGSCSPPAR